MKSGLATKCINEAWQCLKTSEETRLDGLTCGTLRLSLGHVSAKTRKKKEREEQGSREREKREKEEKKK